MLAGDPHGAAACCCLGAGRRKKKKKKKRGVDQSDQGFVSGSNKLSTCIPSCTLLWPVYKRK